MAGSSSFWWSVVGQIGEQCKALTFMCYGRHPMTLQDFDEHLMAIHDPRVQINCFSGKKTLRKYTILLIL